MRSDNPAGDWRRVIVNVFGVRNSDGTQDLLSNRKNVVKGASAELWSLLFCESLYSWAFPGDVTGPRQDDTLFCGTSIRGARQLQWFRLGPFSIYAKSTSHSKRAPNDNGSRSFLTAPKEAIRDACFR